MISLRGKSVLVTGGSRGLGAATAHAFAREGANVLVDYISDEASAAKVATQISDQHGVKADTVQGDVGAEENCVRIVNKCIAVFGSVDVIVSNAGWTRISDFGYLHALSEADWDKVAIPVRRFLALEGLANGEQVLGSKRKANLYLLRAASESFNANPDGGSFLISSSVAGTIPSGSSMVYSVTKAAGLHLMRCLAQTQGPKVRVNAVLPGLLLTDWGNRLGTERVEKMRE